MKNFKQWQINRIPVELPPPRVKSRGVFAEKLANHLRETPMRKLARQFFGLFAFVFLTPAILATIIVFTIQSIPK